MNFKRIKKNYENELFDKQMVRQSYKKGVITIYEYYLIIGTVEDEDVPEGLTKEEFIELLIKGDRT